MSEEQINPSKRHSNMNFTNVGSSPPLSRRVEGNNDAHRFSSNPFAAPKLRERTGLSGCSIFLVTVFTGLFGLVFAIIFLVFAVYAYYQFSGLIVPGVRLGDVSLGGMSFTQASLALHRAWESELQITVTNGTQSSLVTPADLGLGLDEIRTAQRAVDVGRGSSIVAELAMMAVSAKDGWPLDAEVSFDEEAGRIGLQNLAQSMSLPPENATIRMDGGQLVQVPSQVGYTIDIDGTLHLIRGDPGQVLSSGTLQVVPQFIPAEINDASAALDEARQLIDVPAVLSAYDAVTDEHFSWAVPRDRLSEWLAVTNSETGIQVSFDDQKVGEYLQEKNNELGSGRYLDVEKYSALAAESLRQGGSTAIPLSHFPGEYIVRPGDTLLRIAWQLGFPSWAILNANPGLNPDALTIGSKLVIPSPDVLLPLPPVPNKRIVISISEQRLWVFQDGGQIKKFIISTGIDRSPTQPGIFQVQTHVRNAYASVWDLNMPDFLGIYEAWPGFMNGIHGLPTLSNGRRLWANILGKPASYGCIILDLDDAAWLYDWAENGVVVKIQP